jgi:hypothetical protein
VAGNTLYETDLYAWTREQAGLLRAGRLDELDIEHLAEEIEAVGSSQRHELRRRLARLLQHLLKFEYQPELRSRSWRVTIAVQRSDISVLLADNATLRATMDEILPGAYRLARLWTEDETGLERLPKENPYTIEYILGGELPAIG